MTYEEVRVRDCACPDTPHPDGDVVYMNDKLSAAGGLVAEMEINKGVEDEDDLTRRLLLAFVRYEATGWNLLDERGKPVPFSVDDLLADWTMARAATIRAGELYIKTAIAPFQKKPAERSQTGRTPATTSRTRRRTRTQSESPSPTSSEASPPSMP